MVRITMTMLWLMECRLVSVLSFLIIDLCQISTVDTKREQHERRSQQQQQQTTSIDEKETIIELQTYHIDHIKQLGVG